MVDLPWLNQGTGAGSMPQYGISSLIQAIPAMQYGFQGINTAPQADIVNQMRQVAGAQMDTSNPLYQQLYGQFKQQGRHTLNQGINELASQNRKLSAMGRTPLLDQERGGEQLWRGAMQGYQNADDNALMNTQMSLGLAGRTLGNAYQPASNLATQQKQSKAMQTELGWGGVGNLVKGLFGL